MGKRKMEILVLIQDGLVGSLNFDLKLNVLLLKHVGFLSFGTFSFLSGAGKGRGQVLKYYIETLR